MDTSFDADYLNSLRQALNNGFLHSNMLMMTSEQIAANRMSLYNLFAYDVWDALPYDIRCDAVQALENDFAFQQGRDAKFVSIEPLEDGYYGKWSPRKNCILLNENLVERGTLVNTKYAAPRPDANMQIFDTIAHEGYHAYQSYALEHPEVHQDKEQLRDWALNTGKYFNEEGSDLKRDEYLIQPMERDAWHYGYNQTEKAFAEIEKNHGEEPGRYKYENESRNNSYDLALAEAESMEPGILDRMESEMIEGCEEKGINYDFGGQKETESEDRSNYENRFIPPDVEETTDRQEESEEKPEEQQETKQEDTEAQEEAAEETTEKQQETTEEKIEEQTHQDELTMDQMVGEDQTQAQTQAQNEEVTMDKMVGEDQTQAQTQAQNEEVTMDKMVSEDQTQNQNQAQNQEVSMDKLVGEGQTQTENQAQNQEASMDKLVSEDQKQTETEDVNMGSLAPKSEDQSVDTTSDQSTGESEEEEEDHGESYGY